MWFVTDKKCVVLPYLFIKLNFLWSSCAFSVNNGLINKIKSTSFQARICGFDKKSPIFIFARLTLASKKC